MRIVGVAALALVGVACGGASAVQPEPRPTLAPEAQPASAPLASVVPSVASRPESWTVEVVATTEVLRNAALAVGPEGTSITFVRPSTRRIERVRRATASWWSPEHVTDGASARVAFDRRSDVGPSWALLGDEPVLGKLVAGAPAGVWAQRLTLGSRPERVLDGSVRASSVALDRAGAPHACVSTNEHPALSYATRGKQGWSSTTIGKESERCAIAVADDGALVVASANVAEVEAAVRSPAGVWKTSALSAGERFAAVDTAILGKDAAIAFSAGSQVRLARLDANGTWTQSVLVPDAGGIVGAIALALDSAGRARVACSIRREKESSDEIALLNEVTGTSTTVTVDDTWRFTSLALVLDAQDHPHIAYTGASGRLFYASVAP